ncbi:hypothetical protein T484DRAFT_2946201 [Baffinella frigidus]|nr:hypothetical protein T484DRAFT_2946201 [Cryptophyta sp. CCMP2293]
MQQSLPRRCMSLGTPGGWEDTVRDCPREIGTAYTQCQTAGRVGLYNNNAGFAPGIVFKWNDAGTVRGLAAALEFLADVARDHDARQADRVERLAVVRERHPERLPGQTTGKPRSATGKPRSATGKPRSATGKIRLCVYIRVLCIIYVYSV